MSNVDIDLLKLIRKADKHPFRPFIKYARYKKFFSDFGIKLKNCLVLPGVNIILLVDRKSSVVYRCSLNKLGHTAVLRNYEFLQSSEMSNVPKPCGLWQKGSIAVSAESLVNGRHLRADEVDAEVINTIFDQLYSVYRQNMVVVNFDINKWFAEYDYFLQYYNGLWVDKLHKLKEIIIQRLVLAQHVGDNKVANTRIHGDLTFRNIVLNGDKFAFLDFDRWGVDFPEFDIFLFHIDNLTHREKSVTYKVFFTYIMQFVKGRRDVSAIETFYDVNTEFNINKRFENDIKNLFLYRTLVHILQSFDNRESQPLRLLDEILYEF